MQTNEQVLRRLFKLCRAARQIDVGVVLLLIEVEDRRLHLEAACSSLHEFCRRHLRWSEGTTHRRIEAARVARRCPSIVGYLRSGAITMSALALVRAHIDESNVGAWVPRLAGRSRREVEAMVADLAPRPDVPSLIRQLPSLPNAAQVAAGLAPATTAPTPDGAQVDVGAYVKTPDAGRVQTLPAGSPLGVGAPGLVIGPPPPARPVRLQPLGDARWKLQLMARQPLHDKVERAQALMRHRNPSGDLAVIFEAALDALIERLEKPRRLRVPAKARAQRPIRDGEVAASTRREVFARDEERCTFVSEDGQRCPATERLEIDHILSKALGGSGEASNLRLRCQPHNLLHAERVFGRAHVERRIQERKASRRTSTVEARSRPSEAHEHSGEAGSPGERDATRGGKADTAANATARETPGVAHAAPTRDDEVSERDGAEMPTRPLALGAGPRA